MCLIVRVDDTEGWYWSDFIYCAELKEAKLRKKQLQRQLKAEEQLASAARTWNIEILPNWDGM